MVRVTRWRRWRSATARSPFTIPCANTSCVVLIKAVVNQSLQVCLTLLMCLYVLSYALISRHRARQDKDDVLGADDDDYIVYGLTCAPIACCFARCAINALQHVDMHFSVVRFHRRSLASTTFYHRQRDSSYVPEQLVLQVALQLTHLQCVYRHYALWQCNQCELQACGTISSA